MPGLFGAAAQPNLGSVRRFVGAIDMIISGSLGSVGSIRVVGSVDRSDRMDRSDGANQLEGADRTIGSVGSDGSIAGSSIHSSVV